MAADEILVKFFVIITLLFFVPKVLNRLAKIPDPITELMLGIVLGISLSSIFFVDDDMLQIMSTIGIITLFVFAGMEIDTKFISQNKRYFLEHIMLHLLIIIPVGIAITIYFSVSYQMAFLIALALTTPSASFILSLTKSIDKENKQWIESKAISGEVIGLLVMIVLLNLSDIFRLFVSLITILLLVTLLPYVLEFLYKKIFCKLIGIEFSFIFVVAIISAYVTEFVHIHFLVGAFFAGYVSKRFIQDLVDEGTYEHISEPFGQQLIVGFGFFALVFAPFYFFTVGLKMELSMFSFETLLLAGLLCLVIVLIRIVITFAHRMIRIKENFLSALKISAMLSPTLVFTFVIAEILSNDHGLDPTIYSALMLYGLFTALIGTCIFLLTKPAEDAQSETNGENN